LPQAVKSTPAKRRTLAHPSDDLPRGNHS